MTVLGLDGVILTSPLSTARTASIIFQNLPSGKRSYNHKCCMTKTDPWALGNRWMCSRSDLEGLYAEVSNRHVSQPEKTQSGSIYCYTRASHRSLRFKLASKQCETATREWLTRSRIGTSAFGRSASTLSGMNGE